MNQYDLFVEADGASKGNGKGPSAVGFVIYSKNGDEMNIICEGKKFLAPYGVTNNVSEYKALILALQQLIILNTTLSIEIRMDSNLVVNQVNNKWKINEAHLKPLAESARNLMKQLKDVRLIWIPRELNTFADKLANIAIDEYHKN